MKISTSAWARIEVVVFALLVLSRLWIAFGWGPYISDLLIYHHSAIQGLEVGRFAYRDYFFPYPPAALLFTSPPAWGDPSFESYRVAYHVLFLAVDGLILWLMARVARLDLGLAARGRAVAWGLYAAFGLLQGHLLYDRLDLLMALGALLSVEAFRAGRGKLRLFTWNFFFLVKLLPLFWAPWSVAFDEPGPKGSRLPAVFERAAKVVLAFVPSVVILLFFVLLSGGALVSSLGDHGERSIQIEATWASLLFLPKLFGAPGVEIIHKWGALHIAPHSIPGVVDFLSRWLGWIALGAAFAWLHLKGFRRLESMPARERAELHAKGILLILLWLVTGQRVFSPQFLLWIAPLLALFVARRRSLWLASFALLAYGTTYWGFDLRYAQFINGDLFTTGIFVVRNLAVALMTLWFARDVARSFAPVARKGDAS